VTIDFPVDELCQLGKMTWPRCLSFLIWKLGTIIIPTSQSWKAEQVDEYKVLSTVPGMGPAGVSSLIFYWTSIRYIALCSIFIDWHRWYPFITHLAREETEKDRVLGSVASTNRWQDQRPWPSFFDFTIWPGSLHTASLGLAGPAVQVRWPNTMPCTYHINRHFQGRL
jgi:hypothetical protein